MANLPVKLWGRFQRLLGHLVALAEGCNFLHLAGRQRRRKRRSFPLWLEALETRLVPTGQWASSVVDVSSQLGDPNWAATQALGAPDTLSYGHQPTAWAPVAVAGAQDYLTLGYNTPVYASGVAIRETYGNGFVTEVDLIDVTGAFQTIWTGTDPTEPGSVGEFVLSFPETSSLIDAVRVVTAPHPDADTWGEIDAVELLGYSPPTLTVPPNPTNNEGDTVALQLSATDPEGLPLTYSANGLPPGLTINNQSGLISGTLPSNIAQTNGSSYYVPLQVSDGVGSDSVAITWTVLGQPPTVVNPGNQWSAEDDQVALPITASDASDTIASYSAISLPPGLSIDSQTGLIDGTIDANAGGTNGETYAVQVTAMGTKGGQASTRFAWTVNHARPVVNNPGDQSSSEGNGVALQVTASDRDDTVTAYSAQGLPAGLSIAPSTGLILGTVAYGAASSSFGTSWPGVYAVTVTATNSQGTQGSTNFIWNVGHALPTIVSPGDQANSGGDTVSLPITGADPDGGPIVFGASGLPQGLDINAGTGLINGTISYAAALSSSGSNANGTYNVQVTATNNEGAQASTGFTWIISPIPPTVTSPGNQSGADGSTVVLTITASAPDASIMGYAASGLPAGLAIDSATGVMSGTIDSSAATGSSGTGTPGSYAVTVTVGDSLGAQGSTSFVWTVTPALPLVVVPGDQSSAEGDTIALQVTASVADATITGYTASGLPGGLSIDASTGLISGSIDYSAAQNSSGTNSNGGYTVTVTASDNLGAQGSASFAWSVAYRLAPPTLNNPSNQASAEGDVIRLQVTATDPTMVITYAASGLPGGLAIDPSTGQIAGTIDYQAAENSFGTNTSGAYVVTVTATNSQGWQGSTSFLWTVSNRLQPPSVTNPGNQSDSENDTVSLQLTATTPDATITNYAATGLPAGLSLDATTGLISGTIPFGAAATGSGSGGPGSYAIIVTVSDSVGDQGSTSFTWTVSPGTPALSAGGAPAPLAGDPGSALADNSINPWFNTTSRLPDGGSAGFGVANSFVGDAPSIAAANGAAQGSSGGTAALGNLFALLNPLGNANPLYGVSTLDQSTPLFQLHGGNLSAWSVYTGSGTLPVGPSTTGTSSFTVYQAGMDSQGTFTSNEPITDSYQLQETGTPNAGTFVFDETVLVTNFTLTRSDFNGDVYSYGGNDSLVVQLTGSYSGTSFNVAALTLDETGEESFHLDQASPQLSVDDADTFTLFGSGPGGSLDSLTLDKSGTESFTLRQQGQSTAHQVVDTVGSTTDASASYTLVTQGTETFTQHQSQQLQSGTFVTTAFSREDDGAATFDLQQQGSDAAHSVLDSVGSVVDSSDSYTLSKQGTQSFIQDQEGQDQMGVLVISSLTRDDSGSDTFSITDQSTSAWHLVLDNQGSTTDGTDSFTVTQTGPESYSQHLDGDAQGGVAVATSLTRNDAAQASFSLQEQGTSAYHLVDPGNSMQDGTDSFTQAKSGNQSLTQTLVGQDQSGAFVISQLTSDGSGSDSFTFQDQGTSAWTDLPDSTGSSDSGTDSYTQTQLGSEGFQQHQTGQDQGGVFVIASLSADSTSNVTFTLFQDQGTSSWHTVVDDWGSTEDGTDSYTSTQQGTSNSSQHQDAALDQNGQLAITAFTQTSSGSDTYSLQDQATTTSHTVVDTYGSTEDDTDTTSQTSEGSDSFSKTLNGHDDNGNFTVDSLISTSDGTTSFTLLEQSTSNAHTVTGDPVGTDDATDSTTQNSQATETYSEYQAGHDQNGAFTLDSFTLDKQGAETKVALENSGDTWNKVLDNQGSTETDTDMVTANTDSADSYTLHREGQDIAGQFVTTSETGHQQGTQTFTLREQSSLTQDLQVDGIGSTDDYESNETQEKTGAESFVLDKSGQAVAGAFRITNLTVQRSGSETFHNESTTSDTSHTLVDQVGSIQDVTAQTTLTEDGTDSFTMQQVGSDNGNGFRPTSYATTQQGAETYTQTSNTNTSWFTFLFTVHGVPNGTEDGNDDTYRVSQGTNSFVLNETGSDDGNGFTTLASALNQGGTEHYTQTENATKNWQGVTDPTDPNMMRTDGTLTDNQTHVGDTTYTATQTVSDDGLDETVNKVSDRHTQDRYTETTIGHNHAVYDLHPEIATLESVEDFTLTKQGNSTTDEHNTSTDFDDERIATSFITDQSGQDSFHLDDDTTKDGQGVYCHVYAFMTGGTIKDLQNTWAVGHDEQTLSKDDTSSYTLHQEGDGVGDALAITASSGSQSATDTFHLDDDTTWQQWTSSLTSAGWAVTGQLQSTGHTTKDGNSQNDQQSTATSAAGGGLVTDTLLDQSGAETFQTTSATTTQGGPAQSDPTLPTLNNVQGTSYRNDWRTGNSSFSLHEETLDRGQGQVRLLAFDVDEHSQETFQIDGGGDQSSRVVTDTYPGSSDVTQTDQYMTHQEGNVSLDVSEHSTPIVNPPTWGPAFVLSSMLHESGSDSDTRSDNTTQTVVIDNGVGLTSNLNAIENSNQQGSDSFSFQEQAHTVPGGAWVLDSTSLEADSAQTTDDQKTMNQTWHNHTPEVDENGGEASSQSRQDQFSVHFTTAGHLGDNGWQDDELDVIEQGQETFAFAHSGSKTTTTYTPDGMALDGAQLYSSISTTIGGSASDQGTDSFTFTQQGTPTDGTLTLNRQGTDAYTHAPGAGMDSFTVNQQATLTNGVITGSQSGSTFSNWVWPAVQVPLGFPPVLVSVPDVGPAAYAWEPQAGDGVVPPTGPLVFPGAQFAALVLSAGNPWVGTGPAQPNSNLGFVLPYPNRGGVGALEVQGASTQLGQGVLMTLEWGTSAATVLGANQAQVWTQVMEGVLVAWQQAVAQVSGGVLGRFSSLTRWQAIDELPGNLGPTSPGPTVTPWSGDLLRDSSNFFAAWADKLTYGLTAKARQGLGYDDTVDKNSAAYITGSAVGQLHNIALDVAAGGAGGLLGAAQHSLQVAGMATNAVGLVQSLQTGDFAGALTAVANGVLVGMRGLSACGLQSTATAWLARGLRANAVGQLVQSSMGKFAQGDWFGGLVDLADAGANLYMMGCFAAGTPLLTPTGHKAIEKFQVGDAILARSESDPEGALEVKQVEEVFVRLAPILHLHVGGQVIRTTAEHPFYVRHKGWLAAGDLEIDDLLSGHDGTWVPVDDLLDTGEYETVYNLRVQDFHTYFVGAMEWAFSVWAHNSYETPYRDPQRTGYNNGKVHIDHKKARAFGGSNRASNKQRLAAETNLRKGGHEGALKAYERYLIRNGMSPADARKVIQGEIDSLGQSPPPRPTNPGVLDALPINPLDQ